MNRSAVPRLLLIVTLFSGSVATGSADQSASGTNQTGAGTDQTVSGNDQTGTGRTLSLEQAMQLAETHDSQILLAGLNLNAAQIEYDRRRSSGAAAATKISNITSESDLAAAKLAHSRDINNAIVTIVEDAYALQAAQLRTRERVDQQSSRQLALDLALGQVASGAVDNLGVLAARGDLNRANADRVTAERSTELAKSRLGRRLGTSVGATVTIHDLPAFQPYRAPDDAATRAQNADPDIEQKRAAVQLAEIDLDKVRSAAGAPLDIRKAENDLAVARTELLVARDAVDATLQDELATVQQTADDYISAATALDIATQRHAIIVRQHRTGQKSDLDVLNDNVSLDESEANELEALARYTRAWMQVEALMGIDLLHPGAERSSEQRRTGDPAGVR